MYAMMTYIAPTYWSIEHTPIYYMHYIYKYYYTSMNNIINTVFSFTLILTQSQRIFIKKMLMFLLFSLWLRRLKKCMCIFVLHVSRALCTCKSKYIEERCVCFSKFNIYINSLVVDHISMTNHITWILRGTLPPPDKQTKVPNYNFPWYLIFITNDHMLHIAGAKLIALTKNRIHESFAPAARAIHVWWLNYLRS